VLSCASRSVYQPRSVLKTRNELAVGQTVVPSAERPSKHDEFNWNAEPSGWLGGRSIWPSPTKTSRRPVQLLFHIEYNLIFYLIYILIYISLLYLIIYNNVLLVMRKKNVIINTALVLIFSVSSLLQRAVLHKKTWYYKLCLKI